eukprot:1194336-Prorocentrum_minimum.AAC.2
MQTEFSPGAGEIIARGGEFTRCAPCTLYSSVRTRSQSVSMGGIHCSSFGSAHHTKLSVVESEIQQLTKQKRAERSGQHEKRIRDAFVAGQSEYIARAVK